MKIWIDRLLGANHDVPFLEKLIRFHCQLVTDSLVIDLKQFQLHTTWLEENLKKGNIAIEVWATPDEVVKKGFYWNSYSLRTEPSDSLENAVKSIPNADRILEVARLVNKYGINRRAWNCSDSLPPEISQSVCNVLGLHNYNTSPEGFFEVATKHMRVDLYSLGYVQRVAKFHNCDAVLEIGNTLTTLF